MKPLAQQYNHKETEKRWQAYWESNQVYAWDESETRENTYVIDTPPPTVSGLLHMGHIFSYTQADFVARYQRMQGKTVFYPMGFDDNGLPTERLVEKVKKVRATDMSREAFIKLCEDVSEEARTEFRALFTEVALSVDWNHEYHTISEDSRRISQLSFLDLYNKDQAYRKLQPMLWDTKDKTALAQAEFEDKELSGTAIHIEFGIVDQGTRASTLDWNNITHKEVIMTTRPEFLASCVALMCHPDDEAKYTDKMAVTPLFNVLVPIIADSKVDKEKGTGLVMCCTYGDETDMYWVKKYDLESRLFFNYSGIFVPDMDEEDEDAPIPPFMGKAWITNENCIDVKKTRGYFKDLEKKKISNPSDPKNPGVKEKITELLDEEGLLQSIKNEDGSETKKKAIIQSVKCAERSGAKLEIMETNQWFIKVLDHKEALKAKASECNWYPSYMKVRMDQWIDGLSWDWCISRQRYFGVPFPVWYLYDAENNPIDPIGEPILADKEDLPVNPLSKTLPKRYKGAVSGIVGGYDDSDTAGAWEKDVPIINAIHIESGKTVKLIPEKDVMDTWATSSVSPQLSSKAINKDYAVDYARHQKLFPADLRPQAHEIIRTWAFYTVVKAHLHENTIPWKNLMISGWCLASDKTKMSKSKGNVVTPVALIEEKGSDVVRYWASTSRLGADTAYSEDVLKIGKKLTTKLWNASKFAAIHLDKVQGKPVSAKDDVEKGVIYETLDLWVLTRLQRAIAKATAEFDKYEYCNARIAAEDFFWNDFCDNYLELVKTRSYDEAGVNPKGQQSAVHTIYHCLDGILRLFAPFVPHITDELYSHIFDEKFAKLTSIHARGTWPKAANYPVNEQAEQAGIAAVSILNAVRKLKAAKNVSIKWPLDEVAVSSIAKDNKAVWDFVSPLLADLKNVTNAAEIHWKDALPKAEDAILQVDTDDNLFSIAVRFGEKSDAA